MNDKRKPPRWAPPLSVVAIGLLVAATTFLLPSSFHLTGQAAALVLSVRLFCFWPPIVNWFRSMPIPHRCIFGALLWAIVAGHFTLSSRKYYPFVAWAIFASQDEHDPVTCQQFMATTASGKQVRLIMEQLFPSVIQMNTLEDPSYFPPETVERLARVLAKAYNASHADDPVHRVDLVQVSIPLRPPPGFSANPPPCELLKRYDF